jgi:hypothetical protein
LIQTIWTSILILSLSSEEIIRTSPKFFFNFLSKIPNNAIRSVFSFLSLFQRRRCLEEDVNLSLTLQEIGKLQILYHEQNSTNINESYLHPGHNQKLKFPRSSSNHSVLQLEPFATFCTAYFFNGASFVFLQNALAPLILHLHSNS